MTLNSYWKFKRTIGKSRYDLIESTFIDYPHFVELLKNKRGFNKNGYALHLIPRPDKWNGRGKRPDKIISKTKNISSLHLMNIKNPNIFYGDANDTNDALILVWNDDILEIFIAIGLRNIASDVCLEFSTGGLNAEIELLKSKTVTFNF